MQHSYTWAHTGLAQTGNPKGRHKPRRRGYWSAGESCVHVAEEGRGAKEGGDLKTRLKRRRGADGLETPPPLLQEGQMVSPVSLTFSIPDPLCVPLPSSLCPVCLISPHVLSTAHRPRPLGLSPSHLSTTLQCPPAPGRTPRPAPTDHPLLTPSPPPPLPPVRHSHPPTLRGRRPGFCGCCSARSLILRHSAAASTPRRARPGRWGTPTRLRYLAPHATRPLPAGDSLRGPIAPAAAGRRRPAPAGALSHCPGPGFRGAHAHGGCRHTATGRLRGPWLPLTAAALHCLRAGLPGGHGEYGVHRGQGRGGWRHDGTGPRIGDILGDGRMEKQGQGTRRRSRGKA